MDVVAGIGDPGLIVCNPVPGSPIPATTEQRRFGKAPLLGFNRHAKTQKPRNGGSLGKHGRSGCESPIQLPCPFPGNIEKNAMNEFALPTKSAV
jgi:hypothetical protein